MVFPASELCFSNLTVPANPFFFGLPLRLGEATDEAATEATDEVATADESADEAATADESEDEAATADETVDDEHIGEEPDVCAADKATADVSVDDENETADDVTVWIVWWCF